MSATPRIQGQAVNVHPLLVFVATIVGGQLFGLAGVIFAVPAVGVLRVLFDFFAARLYVRHAGPAPPLVRRGSRPSDRADALRDEPGT